MGETLDPNGVSQDPRPGTKLIGGSQDPRPRTLILLGTWDPRLSSLKEGSVGLMIGETGDPKQTSLVEPGT